MVGTYTEFWDKARTKPKEQICHSDEGLYRKWYENGQLEYEKYFRNGDRSYLHGLETSYFDDGTKRAEKIWIENEIRVQRDWREDGTPSWEGALNDTHSWGVKYYANGKKESE